MCWSTQKWEESTQPGEAKEGFTEEIKDEQELPTWDARR